MDEINLIGVMIMVSVAVVGALLYRGATVLENDLETEKRMLAGTEQEEATEDADGECEI
ncbi:MAG: hypothetical protein OEY01_10615 [Desulfobulbaceae bacterium]|nr:hypothetical protein [Desulfobulbaceae bacterium]HIJ79401.1 hypothetical protein [Deltaproteobacteria bacterium]